MKYSIKGEKDMSKINNESEIERLTGLKIGKLFYKGEELGIYKGGEYIFDLESGNFHFLPVVNEKIEMDLIVI